MEGIVFGRQQRVGGPNPSGSTGPFSFHAIAIALCRRAGVRGAWNAEGPTDAEKALSRAWRAWVWFCDDVKLRIAGYDTSRGATRLCAIRLHTSF